MLHLPGSRTPRRRAGRRGYSSLLYGHALDLPPSPLAAPVTVRTDAGLAAIAPLAAALRPFQSHVYRQRVLAALLRLLALAALAAVVTLTARIAGLALPLPAGPLAAAGAVLLAGLAMLPAQRPTAPQLAHEIDRRLGLREQVASALELEYATLEGDESTDAAGLRGRATARALRIVRDYKPAGLLPRPSLRREAYTLLGLALAVAVAALLAARAPLASPAATVLARATASTPRRGASPRPAARARTVAAPMKILSIGAINRTNPPRPAHPVPARNGRAGARVPVAQSGQRGSGVRLVSGKSPAQGGAGRAGQGAAGVISRSGGQGTPGKGAGARPVQPSGAGTKLSLSAAKNSTAGGVESPEQRALKSLQASIQSAQAQANRDSSGASSQGSGNQQTASQSPGNSANSPSGQGRQGNGTSKTGHKGRGNGAGQRGRGQQGTGGRGNSQQGANGQRGQGAGNGNGAGSNARNGGSSVAVPGQDGSAAEGDVLGRHFGRQGAGTGTDSGASSANQDSVGGVRAALGNGGDLTLAGAPDKGGRLVFSVGQPSRTTGTGGAALSGDTSGAAVSTPGYVAPDSNAITPDDRSVVQGYFTPSSQ